MTITHTPSAPLVVVVGATGTQGGSVIQALAESDRPYRIRALTRDKGKPAAQELLEKGADVVAVNLIVDNVEEVNKAFAGADAAFLVTNFWEHMDMNKEVVEGKMLIDAAKASGAPRIVWSGLPSVSADSAGKYKNVYHFEGKAAVAAYGRASGVPFVDVQAGFYATNFFNPLLAPTAEPDGSFAIGMPMPPATVVPLIDTAHDYGLFVRQVLEAPVFPSGTTVRTAGENISLEAMAAQLSQVSGITVRIKQISAEEYASRVQALGMPPHIMLDLKDTFSAQGEIGYYGGKAAASCDALARKPRTWIEFARTVDWKKVLA